MGETNEMDRPEPGNREPRPGDVFVRLENDAVAFNAQGLPLGVYAEIMNVVKSHAFGGEEPVYVRNGQLTIPGAWYVLWLEPDAAEPEEEIASGW